VQSIDQIELLWAVKEFLDELEIRNTWSQNRNPKSSGEVWVLSVNGAACKPVLEGILPFLISEKKTERANRVLEAWKTRMPRTYRVHP
jgi:hypothetical protein